MTAPDFNAIVSDMVTRRAAHRMNTARTGGSVEVLVSTSCSCGWTSGPPSGNLPPQWAAIDKHLIDDVLPAWQSGVCWCGRAMLLSPIGTWFHAQRTLGHQAAPAACGR